MRDAATEKAPTEAQEPQSLAAHARLEAVVDALDVPALLVVAGRVVHANGAAGTLWGHPGGSALVGQSWVGLVAPRSRDAVQAGMDALRDDPAPGTAVEVQIRNAARTPISLQVKLTALAEGPQAPVLVQCREIVPRAGAAQDVDYQTLLEAVCEVVPNHLFVKDHAGRYLLVNGRMAAGFGQTPEAFIGRTAEELSFLSPAQRTLFTRADAEVRRSGRPLRQAKVELTAPDGSIEYWRVTKRPLLDADGRTVGIVGESEELTPLYEAQQHLAAQQHLLQAVIDQVPIAIWLRGMDGRYVIANRVMANYWDATPEQILGKTADELPGARPEHIKLLKELDARAQDAGGPVTVQGVSVVRRNGATMIRNITKLPLTDEQGELLGIIGISEDVTAHYHAEQRLGQLATALEQAGDAIFITDRSGRIEYVNPAFERLTGYTTQEAVGETPRILKSGEHPPGFYHELWQTLERGEVWNATYTNRRKDGTLYHTFSTHGPVRNADGEITHYVAVQKDMTPQMEFEERLRRSQHMESLGTLAGGIAHDFNNILVPILGYTELLAQHVDPESQQHRYLETVRKAALRARDLVSRILLFSRQSEGQPTNVQIGTIVAEVAHLLESTLPATIRIQQRVEGDLTVLADPAQVHQALMNLCVNAGHAMPEGGHLTLAVEAVDARGLRCYIGRELTGPFVRVTVEDTGHGMDEDTLRQIFEPFFTTKGVGEGTGLGLSTVFGIVEHHDGAIRVSSRPGVGTRFELYFPAADDATHAPDASPAGTGHGSEHLLLVDDEHPVVHLSAEILTQHGYRVTALTDSREALRLLQAEPHRFDLLLTDQTMPEVTGADLAIALRAANAAVPIIVCSGYGDDVLHGPARAAITTHLSKPFRPQELLSLVRHLLDEVPSDAVARGVPAG